MEKKVKYSITIFTNEHCIPFDVGYFKTYEEVIKNAKKLQKKWHAYKLYVNRYDYINSNVIEQILGSLCSVVYEDERWIL